MATNQVLNVVDEVIDGTPKYTITDNADGTKGIALANSVTTQGTNLSKVLFNKIDNVLSYLTPNVTKTIIGTYSTTTQAVSHESISPTWSSSTYVVDGDGNKVKTITGTLSTISGDIVGSYTPTFEISCEGYSQTSNFQGFYANSSKQQNYVAITSKLSSASSYSYSSSDFLTCLNGGGTAFFIMYGASTYYGTCYIKYDFKYSKNKNLTYLNTRDTDLYESDDGTTWTLNQTLTGGTTYDLTNLDKRYYKFEETTSDTTFRPQKINWTTYVTKNSYQNQLLLDNNTSFTNQQRVLIVTPVANRYNYYTSTNNVIADSINTSFSQTNVLDEIVFDYDDISTYSPNLKISCSDTNGVKINAGYNSTYTTIAVYDTATPQYLYTPSAFLDVLKGTSSSTSYFKATLNAVGYNLDFTFDLKKTMSGKINTYIYEPYGTTIVYGSNDNSTWETITSFNQDSAISISFSNYRYIKLSLSVSSLSGGGFVIKYLYLSNMSFIESENANYLSTEDVTSNTINGIACDTLLQASRRYEIIYESGTNKFVART